MTKIYGACDPGINGGIAFILADGSLELYTIPKVGNKVDYRELASLLSKYRGGDVYFCIEDVHSIFGSSAKSNFSFGLIKGFKMGVCFESGYSVDLVPPKKWQKEIWNTTDIVKKGNGRTDTKATSLLAAKRLFPNESFLKGSRSKKPFDGLYDAALIAEYCRRKFS